MTEMTQTAPWPTELEDLVRLSRYRPGWRVMLADLVRDPADTHGAEGRGLTLVITTLGYDTYNPDAGESYRVNHYFIVPAATYNRASWQRWLFDCYLAVERHEAMEFFVIDGSRPFAPLHGPGEDPYVVHEYASSTQRSTSFRGETK